MAKQSEYRKMQREAAFNERRAENQKNRMALCDYCGRNMATDYHEIVSRGMTQGNSHARELSYNRLICSCLCNECHLHSITKERDHLLRLNYERYGYDAVKSTLESVDGALKTGLTWSIPEPWITGDAYALSVDFVLENVVYDHEDGEPVLGTDIPPFQEGDTVEEYLGYLNSRIRPGQNMEVISKALPVLGKHMMDVMADDAEFYAREATQLIKVS